MADHPLVSIEARELRLPFRASFAHASAVRRESESAWVEVRTADGHLGRGEGCPRRYVTGESVEGALAWIEQHRASWLTGIRDRATLSTWCDEHRAAIDRNPAAWCAVELALVDALARAEGETAEAWLGLPPLAGPFRYTAVLGDAGPERFAAELDTYRGLGFTEFKVKLARDPARNRDKVERLRAAGVPPAAVRADGNNLWHEVGAAAAALAALDYPFWALEEPLAAGDLAGLVTLAAARGAAIVLDESLLRAAQVAELPGPPETWVANLRVSKLGGLRRSLEVLEQCRARGIRVVVGAQVGETSLLTRAALTLASAAGPLRVGQEGAFGTLLLERDVIDPALAFGRGGELALAAVPSRSPGFGIDA